jgi:hypothetical protein
VRCGGQESSVGAVTCGVPQGYQVLPFYINADDLQIYNTCAVLDFQRCIDQLNLKLQRVHE